MVVGLGYTWVKPYELFSLAFISTEQQRHQHEKVSIEKVAVIGVSILYDSYFCVASEQANEKRSDDSFPHNSTVDLLSWLYLQQQKNLCVKRRNVRGDSEKKKNMRNASSKTNSK